MQSKYISAVVIASFMALMTFFSWGTSSSSASSYGNNFNFSFSGASVSASVDPSWGIFAFTLFAIVYFVMSINLLKNPE